MSRLDVYTVSSLPQCQYTGGRIRSGVDPPGHHIQAGRREVPWIGRRKLPWIGLDWSHLADDIRRTDSTWTGPTWTSPSSWAPRSSLDFKQSLVSSIWAQASVSAIGCQKLPWIGQDWSHLADDIDFNIKLCAEKFPGASWTTASTSTSSLAPRSSLDSTMTPKTALFRANNMFKKRHFIYLCCGPLAWKGM